MTIHIKDLIADARLSGKPVDYRLSGNVWTVYIYGGRAYCKFNGKKVAAAKAQETLNICYNDHCRHYSLGTMEANAVKWGSDNARPLPNGRTFNVVDKKDHLEYFIDGKYVNSGEFSDSLLCDALDARHPRKNHAMNTDKLSMEIERSLCVTPVASTVKIDAVLAARHGAMAALIEHLLPALGVMTLCMEQLGNADTASCLRLLTKLSKNE